MVLTAVVAVAAVLFLAEQLRPGRRFERVPGWLLRALTFNAVQAAVVWTAGSEWDTWLLAHRPWSADSLGVVTGAVIGYVAITFVYYWWHRWRHSSAFLWRWLHQFHHSPRRIEVLTSFYKHPLEIAINSLLSSAVLYLAVGLGREAATIAVLMTGVAELFYHWNVRTPHWLGYVFQRPESHCVHHQERSHTSNFADLPLWDMLFGTFDNPREWNARCGFEQQRELRVLDMLRGIDVNQRES